MKLSNTKLNPKLQKIIHKISEIAKMESLKVYMVGGIVRDIILGRKNLDLDIVVEGDHLKLVKRLEEQFQLKAVIHSQFMTARMDYDDVRVDIARARKENYPQPGSLPVVSNGLLADDLLRRDFTINALALNINKEENEEVIDLFHGLKDLNKRSIRILHDKSFLDDPTRILRAIRFAGRFGFSVEKNTLELIKKALKNNYIAYVTPNRYWIEFSKILEEKDPLMALELMNKLKAFGFIDPKFIYPQSELKKVGPFTDKIKAKLNWSLVYWLVLMANISKEKIFPLIQKFPFKKLEKKAMLEIQKFRDLRVQLGQAKKQSEVFMLLKFFTPELLVAGVILEKDKKILKRIETFLNQSLVQLDITGEDLKKLGVKEGEKLGRIMSELLMEKIDGKLKNKKAQWQRARQLALER
jgi:tRNA nucleotidyltransferase (CCA-adding enzyme)